MSKGNLDGLQSSCKKCAHAQSLKSKRLTVAVPLPEAALPPTRFCHVCKLTQPRVAFHREASSKDGLHHMCKKCKGAYYARRHAATTVGRAAAATAPKPPSRCVCGNSVRCVPAKLSVSLLAALAPCT